VPAEIGKREHESIQCASGSLDGEAHAVRHALGHARYERLI
jgi:hypothetical protein